jgi:hypothetical protein
MNPLNKCYRQKTLFPQSTFGYTFTAKFRLHKDECTDVVRIPTDKIGQTKRAKDLA